MKGEGMSMSKMLFNLFTGLVFLTGSLWADEFQLMGKIDTGLPDSGRNGSKLGEAVANIGDVNDDGYDDWAIGLPDAAADYDGAVTTGKVYVYFGSGSPVSEADPDLTICGTQDIGRFGTAVDGAGDVNGDGIADLIVGANGEESGGTVARGNVYIFYGSSSFDGIPDVTLESQNTFKFGSCVAGLGDVNHDGYDDVGVGHERYNTAYIYFGGISMGSGNMLSITYGSATEFFGKTMDAAGDVNNDGYDDVIIGGLLSSGTILNSGAAYLFLGGESITGTADVIWYGEAQSDMLGCSVAGVGDVDNDGYDDVLVGAYGNDEAGSLAGKAYLYRGGSTIADTAALTMMGSASGYLGFKVSAAGDMNNDGYADMLISEYNKGWAYIYYGNATLDTVENVKLTGPSGSFAYNIAGGGDINGDGYSDVMSSSHTSSIDGYNSGKVSLFLGSASVSGTADLEYTGEQAYFQVGSGVSNAGDVNGDGYDDIIIGYAKQGTVGEARIFFGGPGADLVADVVLTSTIISERFGRSVSGGGDINGDGYADVIVGADMGNRAYIYYGGSAMDNTADVTLLGSGNFGACVSNAGDVDGDGYDDVLIGSYLDDEIATNAGKATLFFGGPAMDNTADLFFYGEAASDNFGYSLSNAGDVNNDGYDDILVGAYMADPGGLGSAGRAYLYLGGPVVDNIADLYYDGEAAGDLLGFSVSDAGDVNSDGYADILIGAYSNDPDGQPNAGSVYLYYGGSSPDNTADEVLSGTAAEEYFGRGVAGAGDVNNDGYDDILIRESNRDPINGATFEKIRLYYGGEVLNTLCAAEVSAESQFTDFGYSMDGIGDFNGDGIGDIAVGAPASKAVGYYMGRAYVYTELPSLELSTELLTVPGSAGTVTFDINANISWALTKTASWLVPDIEESVASQTVTLTYDASDVLERSTVVTITGASITKTLTLTQVNALPLRVNPLEDMVFMEDFGSDTVNISSVFSDEDNLTFSVDVISISLPMDSIRVVSDSLLVFYDKANATGTGVFVLTASDPFHSSMDTVNLKVNSVADNPVFHGPLPTVTFKEDESAIIDVNIWDDYVTDADGEPVWAYYISGSVNLDAVMDGELCTISTKMENWCGDDSLQLIARDPGGYRDTTFLSVTVTPVNDIPFAFTLTEPAQDESIQDLSPILHWNRAVDPDLMDTVSYTVYYGPDVLGQTMATIVDTFYQIPEALPDNSICFWRVVARDLSGTTRENTEGYRSFVVNTANDVPGDFALLSPADGAMVTDLTPEFIWDAAIDPDIPSKGTVITAYRVFLSTDIIFSGVSGTDVTGTRWTPETALDEDMVYYWKVEAVDAQGEVRSSTRWSFWTNSRNSIPEPVHLLSPENGSILSSNTLTLSWNKTTDNDINDSLNYRLVLGTDIDNMKEIYSGPEQEFSVSDLVENGTYYWNVSAKDLSGAVSENRDSFRKVSINTVNENPAVAMPLSPDSVVVLTLNPKFIWNPSSDPDPGDSIYYEMHVWSNSSFDSVLTSATSCFGNVDLKDNNSYHWDVLTIDRGSGISHSEQIPFWTDLFPEAPDQFKSISPVPKQALDDNVVELKWEKAEDPDPKDYAVYTVKYKSTHIDSVVWHEVSTGTDTSVILNLALGHRYEWQVLAKDDDGFVVESDSSKLQTFDVGEVTAIAFDEIPAEYCLSQNFPNPFNPITHIQYGLPEQTDVKIVIYDLVGRQVRNWILPAQKAGWHEIIWDGSNSFNQMVSTGIYIYRMQAADVIQTRKLIFMK